MQAPVLIETITIPLKTRKVEPSQHVNVDNNNGHNNNNNNDKNCENTGFPFDDSDFGDRDRSFRSHIDDIVQRHPELAEHLNFDRDFERFPFRSNTWGHKRRGSAQSGDESRPSGSTEFPEGRRFGRPFGSRFEERFGFPFSKTFDGEPEFCQQKAQSQSQAESKPPTPPQQTPPQQEQEVKGQQEDKASEKPPQVPCSDRGRKQNPNIPQSSTVDLGQKQDPVHDSRGQRSMSAPPENRAGQQRYVSSINIPIQSGGDANIQQAPPQPQPQEPKAAQTQHSKSNERVIPIHVEGRDEPVVPKRANQTFSQPPPPQPERVYPQPQPERMFGQRPGFGQWERGDVPYYTGEQFFPGDQQFFPRETQYFDGPHVFGNRNEPHPPRANPEEYFAQGGPFRQQQQQYAKQQQKPPQPQQQKPAQQQQQHQQQPTAPPAPPQQQQQHQQQQVPQPQPPPQKAGPIEQIQCIQKDVLQLMDQVEKFNGQPKDKQYLYLDEMLTRNLLKLDDIETEGKENIRQARKEAINCIQRCISILEAKAAANEQIRNQLMQVDAKLENPSAVAASNEEAAPLNTLEVSGVARSGTEVAVDTQPAENEPVENAEGPVSMEVAPCEPAESAEMKPEAMEQIQPVEPETAETKNSEEEPPKVEAAPEVMEVVQQPQEEVKKEEEAAANVDEQLAAGSEAEANTSQPMEATKEEVKDKKEKKKVKKKEKAADKAEKK